MQISIRDKERRLLDETVEAFETSCPHLCVHPTPYTEKSIFPKFAEGWSITHIPSGACPVAGIPSKVLAIAIADWMGPQLDWSGGYDEVRKSATPEFKRVIHDLGCETEEYAQSVGGILELVGLFPMEDAV